MKILLLCFVLLLCSCHIYNKGKLSKPPYLNNPPGTIRVNKKVVDGICYPDYMQEEEVHRYADMFKRDEGDSVHYRLGCIGHWRCVSADSVTCDTLRLFVLKLVPYSRKNQSMTDLTSNVWMVEQMTEYGLVDEKIISMNDSIDDDLEYFGCISVARARQNALNEN